MVQNLDVYLWGRKVGSLAAYKSNHADRACFYFDREFAKGHLDIAPLRASLRSVTVQNGLPVYAEEEKLFGGRSQPQSLYPCQSGYDGLLFGTGGSLRAGFHPYDY
jgi:hypothetical protein